MASVTERDVLNEIRDVTDEEVASYTENGWVFLPALFSRDLAATLLRAAEELVEANEAYPLFRGRRPLSRAGLEPFPAVAHGEAMGRVAHRIINRSRLTGAQIPTRFMDDLVWCREPGCDGSGYHQDSGVEGADRVARINCWIALDEVTPEMGAMRFLTGVHREGLLGVDSKEEARPYEVPAGCPLTADDFRRSPLLANYPKLLELYELSPPFHYRPGDATIHHGYMVHGAPANTSDKPRWSYIVEYTASDTKYFNGAYHGEERVANRSRPMDDDHAYPVVYPRG